MTNICAELSSPFLPTPQARWENWDLFLLLWLLVMSPALLLSAWLGLGSKVARLALGPSEGLFLGISLPLLYFPFLSMEWAAFSAEEMKLSLTWASVADFSLHQWLAEEKFPSAHWGFGTWLPAAHGALSRGNYGSGTTLLCTTSSHRPGVMAGGGLALSACIAGALL